MVAELVESADGKRKGEMIVTIFYSSKAWWSMVNVFGGFQLFFVNRMNSE